MKKTKMEKGITLVALIITIVILLILAAVAIAAIQNENILSHANNAAVKYNSSVDNEQGILGGYLDVLDKYTGNDWITIYEGNATTEDGIAVLAETDLFSYGSFGVPYKITVESDEYTGTVETVPIFGGNQEGMNIYALFAIENGEAIGFNSIVDVENKMANLGENANLAIGISQSGMCGIGFQSATTSEYTIIKIERKEFKIDGTKIFEGELALTTDGTGTLMPELQGILKPTRDYAFEVEINGGTQMLGLKTFCFWGLWLQGILTDDFGVSINLDENTINCNIEGCVLKKVYDLGESTTYAEENGFVAIYQGVFVGKNGWGLIDTPNTSYIVPETVAGRKINGVDLSSIQGTPTFTREVFLPVGEAWRVNNIKIISNNLDFWFEQLLSHSEYFENLNLNVDLTECGDEIVFPQDYLDAGIITYVTSAVKTNYANYDNIIVK